MAKIHKAFRVPGDPGSARCHNCTWSQVVDEDLHEDGVDLLLQWHTVNPAHRVDHLAGPRPGQRPAVSPYVEWFNNQGLLALKDTQTGGRYLVYNTSAWPSPAQSPTTEHSKVRSQPQLSDWMSIGHRSAPRSSTRPSASTARDCCTQQPPQAEKPACPASVANGPGRLSPDI